jgi:hypothetical protein
VVAKTYMLLSRASWDAWDQFSSFHTTISTGDVIGIVKQLLGERSYY